MRIESLITRETLALLKNNKFVSFKPATPVVHQVPSGTFSKHYPLHYKTGDDGKYHPSKKPVGFHLGNGHAFEQARVFGWRSRI